MDIVIRSARPGDIPRMAELLGDLFMLEADFKPDPEKQILGLSSLIADPSELCGVLVAEQSGVVIGMTTVQTLVSTAEGGRVGLVEDVIVDREHRGRGVGSMLLDAVVAWSRHRGLKRLQLLADRGNLPAINFYFHRRWSGTGLICLRLMI
jgi:GNAT superfamily N-acetyltransferase